MKRLLTICSLGVLLGATGCVVHDRRADSGYYQHAYYRSYPDGYWDRGVYHHYHGDWDRNHVYNDRREYWR